MIGLSAEFSRKIRHGICLDVSVCKCCSAKCLEVAVSEPSCEVDKRSETYFSNFG